MKVFNYIFKYKWFTLLIIVLIIVQTTLGYIFPYFNAKIIDIGIQNGGIENCCPLAISSNTYDQLDKLVEDKSTLQVFYEYDNLNNIYKLNTNNSKDIEKISSALEAPLAYLYSPDNNAQSYKVYCENTEAGIISQTAIKSSKNIMADAGLNLGEIQLNYMYKTGLWILILTLLIAVFTYLVNIFITIMSLRIAKNKRSELFNAIMKSSNDQINKFGESSLITRCTNDIQLIQNFSGMVLWILVNAPINIIVAIVISLKMVPMLWWILLLLALGILISSLILIKFCTPVFGKMQSQIDKINLLTREKLSGIFISRAFNRSKDDNIKFQQANEPLYKTQLLIGKILAVINPLINFGFACALMLIIILGGYYINLGQIQVGDIYAFTIYASMIVTSFTSVGLFIGSLPRANVSINRIENVIRSNGNETKDNSNDSDNNVINTDNFIISFNNVAYSYMDNNNYALNDIDFSFKNGETIGIIGTTGSGKTTLINLLLGLQNVSNGCVLYNEENINNINNKEYQSLFGYAPQNSFLFSGDIADNISYGIKDSKHIKDDNLMKYVEISQSKDFISDTSKTGLHKKITQDSINISGGQRQRISIARALASDAPILIFDDCFSELDYEIEKKLLQAINDDCKDQTKIIVTSRITTVKDADKILVLDEGKAVGYDSYNKLLKNCPEFIQILESQKTTLKVRSKS